MKKSLGPKTLAFPTPVWLVGTYDAAGTPNIMTAAWAGIVCSQPPCVGVSLRKATYTYGNLMLKKAFTVSIPPEAYVKEADYCGIASGKAGNKFTAAGLTPVKSGLVDAPYVQEFPLVLECKVIHTIEIGLHTQFIGEVLDVKADDSVLGEKGMADIEKVKPIVFGPEIRTYHGIGQYLGKAFSIGKEL
ncbi:MAG: flavin reductase family protein [Deltaproteobacteria bacterium]|nr:MAG: flavin reductase family protein [Deltaproteobacteria bacterium]